MAYGQANVDTIQSSTTGTAPVFKDGSGNQIGTLCRAWVNFDGTSSGTIIPRANFNVSSITKASTGIFTLNFTNALSDANYSFSIGVSNAALNGTCAVGYSPATQLASSLKIATYNALATATDFGETTVAIFR